MDKKNLLIMFKSKKFVYTAIIMFSAVMAFLFGKRLLKYYGARPSKKDKRDFRIAGAGVQGGFPNEFSLPVPPIKDQGSVSSCVAHSVSYLSESILNPKHKTDRFAVGFVYGYRPSGYYKGEGMYPREAMKTIQQVGNVLHIDFPYNEEVPAITEKVFQEIDGLKRKAFNHRSVKYFQLKSNDEIKSCIMKYGPVSIMYPVHEEFMAPVNGKIDVKGLRRFQGYHQVSLYGWTGNYWQMVNSWGGNWCSNGTALISMSYPWTEAWGFSTDFNAEIAQKKTSFLSFLLGSSKDSEDNA